MQREHGNVPTVSYGRSSGSGTKSTEYVSDVTVAAAWPAEATMAEDRGEGDNTRIDEDRLVEKDVREISALLECPSMGVDMAGIMEVFSPGRTRQVPSLRGVVHGGAFDLRNGCHLSDEILQRKYLQIVNDMKH